MMNIKHNKQIKKGSEVYILSGNDRGSIGKVLNRTDEHAIIQGINVRKKSVKRSEANPNGGFVSIERPIHISKLKLAEGKK